MGSATQEKQDILVTKIQGSQKKHINRYLFNADDETNANTDFSGANDDVFDIVPALGEIWRIQRLIVYVESSTNATMGNYGDQTALTEGLQIAKNGS